MSPGPRSRSGLLDVRVGRRAAAMLRTLAVDARGLAPGRVGAVVLVGPRALGTASPGDPYDVRVEVGAGAGGPGLADDLADLCLDLLLDGHRVRARPVGPGDAAAVEEGIAIEGREGAPPGVRRTGASRA